MLDYTILHSFGNLNICMILWQCHIDMSDLISLTGVDYLQSFLLDFGNGGTCHILPFCCLKSGACICPCTTTDPWPHWCASTYRKQIQCIPTVYFFSLINEEYIFYDIFPVRVGIIGATNTLVHCGYGCCMIFSAWLAGFWLYPRTTGILCHFILVTNGILCHFTLMTNGILYLLSLLIEGILYIFYFVTDSFLWCLFSGWCHSLYPWDCVWHSVPLYTMTNEILLNFGPVAQF